MFFAVAPSSEWAGKAVAPSTPGNREKQKSLLKNNLNHSGENKRKMPPKRKTDSLTSPTPAIPSRDQQKLNALKFRDKLLEDKNKKQKVGEEELSQPLPVGEEEHTIPKQSSPVSCIESVTNPRNTRSTSGPITDGKTNLVEIIIPKSKALHTPSISIIKKQAVSAPKSQREGPFSTGSYESINSSGILAQPRVSVDSINDRGSSLTADRRRQSTGEGGVRNSNNSKAKKKEEKIPFSSNRGTERVLGRPSLTSTGALR